MSPWKVRLLLAAADALYDAACAVLRVARREHDKYCEDNFINEVRLRMKEPRTPNDQLN